MFTMVRDMTEGIDFHKLGEDILSFIVFIICLALAKFTVNVALFHLGSLDESIYLEVVDWVRTYEIVIVSVLGAFYYWSFRYRYYRGDHYE